LLSVVYTYGLGFGFGTGEASCLQSLAVGTQMAHAIASEVSGFKSLVLEFWIQIPEHLGESLADFLLGTPFVQQGIHLVGLISCGGVRIVEQGAFVVQILFRFDSEVESSLDGLIGF